MSIIPQGYETSYDPAEEAQQDVIRKAFQPEEVNFWNMFSAGQDLTTDLGRQAWATTGLSGEALSKLPGHTQEDQRTWYVQKNAVDYGLNELNKVIDAYEQLGLQRNFTEEEANQFEEVLERKQLLEGDLAFIHDSLEGNRDAPMFDNGNSFNDVWATDHGDTAGISEVMDFAMENPTAMAGLLVGEIVKDIPISILSFFGLTKKIGKGSSIIDKVHKTINKLKPKTLQGLAYLGTGTVAGATAGASYEYAYSQLEEGEAKPKHIEQGATFGAIFGVLGGLGLMYQGKQIRGVGTKGESIVGSVASVAKQTSASVLADSEQNLKHLQKVADDMVDEADRKSISQKAEAMSILNDRGYEQDVKYVKGREVGNVAYTVPDPATGKMITYLDRQALEKEWLRLKNKFEAKGEIDGVSIKQLTPREVATLKNRDAYEALVLAKEKAKGVLVLDHIKEKGTVQGINPDIDNQAFDLAKSELDKFDAKQKEVPKDNPSDEQVKQAVAAEADEQVTPPPPGFIATTLEKHPTRSALGLGAAGYVGAEAMAEDQGLWGLAAGAIAGKMGGAKLMKVLNKNLNATVLETKRAFSEQSSDYGMMAKITEYRMNNILERMTQVFPDAKSQENLIEALETGKKFKNKTQESVKNEIKTMLHIIGKEAQDAGIIKQAGDVAKLKFGKFEKDKKGSYLYNYFPHIFRKEVDDAFLEELLTKFGSTTTPSGNRRTMMGTLKEISEQYPDKNVILDPGVALATYTKAMTKAIYGRRMVDSLRRYNLEFDSGRIPAMMTKEDLDALTGSKAELLSKKGKKEGKRGLSQEEAAHYEYFTHPSLKGYVAHNNVKNLIDGHFKTIRKGSAVDLAESALKFGNALKRISVFGSLFHAQALILSFSYVMGVSGAIKGIGGSKFKGKVGKGLKVQGLDGTLVDLDWSHLKLGTGMYQQLVEEAISWNVGIGDTKSRHLVNEGKETMDNFLARHLGEGSIPAKAFEVLDHITWDQLHDRFKIAGWLNQRHKLMEQGISHKRASEMASVFVNDAFGGLDWDGFASRLYKFAQKNPHSIRGKIAPHIAAAMPSNNRKWFNAALFAPDWTVSNLRIVGNLVPLTARTIKAMKSEGFMKAFQKNPSMKSQEAKELLAAWKMYGAYTTRAGLQTTMLWWTLSQANGWFSGPESPEPDFDEFMKFWITGKLDLGGGETMVISKQIVEPIHWVTNFRHTLMNKGAILPKTAIEGMMNKQWFTLKGDNPYGPAISDKEGSHYFEYLGKKVMPIVIGPAFDDRIDWAERVERIATGAIGFPQYQSKQ
jgi:hypothetical protein